MPRGDGTGPSGQGPGSGRGLRGSGMGRGMRNIVNNRAGAGPGGDCVCPACGAKKAHSQGMPCSNQRCPECGAFMARG